MGTELLVMIGHERRGFADLIDGLSPAQLATPSLCGEWTVQEVAGHLVAAVAAPDRWILPAMVRGGFRLHKANALMARRMAERPAAELADMLRANAEKPFQPPIVGYPGQLTDLQVHAQDIRRPLGLPPVLEPDRLRISLDFLVGGRAVGFTPRKRPAGLRFETTDLDWSWGSGPVVRGPAEAVLMALTGRAVALPDLDGDGVSVLRQRIAG